MVTLVLVGLLVKPVMRLLVMAAKAFAGGVTIVKVGVVVARDTSGSEMMLNTCYTHAICHS